MPVPVLARALPARCSVRAARARALSRTTAVLVAVFMLNSLALAYMGTKKAAAPKTIFDTAAETAPAASIPLSITVPGTGANSGRDGGACTSSARGTGRQCACKAINAVRFSQDQCRTWWNW